jgi:hypothetical protein
VFRVIAENIHISYSIQGIYIYSSSKSFHIHQTTSFLHLAQLSGDRYFLCLLGSSTGKEHSLREMQTVQNSFRTLPYYLRSLLFFKKLCDLSRKRIIVYRPSDHRLTANLVSTFAVIGCDVVIMTDPDFSIPGSRPEPHFFFRVVPQLYSQG